MLLRLGLASLALPFIVVVAGAWPGTAAFDLAHPAATSVTTSMATSQSPPRSGTQAINRKAGGRSNLPSDSARVALRRDGTAQREVQRGSGQQAARDYLPQSWWPVESRLQPTAPEDTVKDQPPVTTYPAPSVANPVEQRLAHPREFIAGHVPVRQPVIDDSEGRSDPIGRTLSGATPDEPAGADEVSPEEPPSHDVTAADDNGRIEQAHRPQQETAEPLESPDGAASPSAKLKPLTPEQIALRDKIRRVREIYQQKHLNTRDHGNWETMHAIVAYGVDAEIRVGSPYGRKVNAIGWICWNGQCARERMFLLRGDSLQPRNGPGLQGHDGQLLAILAQARVKSSYPLQIGGRAFTVADLVSYEQVTCEPNSELTFKLIGLNRYLEPDTTWTDRRGREWSLEKLVQEELKQPIIGAACGGTHRLFGLTYAYKRREALGMPVTGHFQRAKIFITDYQQYAWRLQNSDGSFSTNWFAGRGDQADIDRKLQTSGHISEWLAFSLPQQELEEQRMQRAIEFLVQSLAANQSRDWRIGPLGHALNALRIYDDRVFKPREQAERTVTSTEANAAIPTGGQADPDAAAAPLKESAAPRTIPYAAAIAAGQEMARQKQAVAGDQQPVRSTPAGAAAPEPLRTADESTSNGPQLIGPR